MGGKLDPNFYADGKALLALDDQLGLLSHQLANPPQPNPNHPGHVAIYEHPVLCQDSVDAFIAACTIGGTVSSSYNNGTCP